MGGQVRVQGCFAQFQSLEGNFWDCLSFRFKKEFENLNHGNFGFSGLVCWKLLLRGLEHLWGIYVK